MEITCPNCGIKLELPSGIQEGRHLRCSVCDKKFLYNPKPKMRLKIHAQVATKMPLPTKIACILFYLLYIGSTIDCIADFLKSPISFILFLGTLAVNLYLICLVNNVRKRRRTALTVAHSLIILGCATLCIAAKAGMISALIIIFLVIPLIPLWLPASNRWFRGL